MYKQTLANLSRRGFLKGSAIGTAALATGAGLAACSPSGSGTEGTAATEAGGAASADGLSFMTAPDPVDENAITDTVEREVIVIGSGVSGMCMGARLAELGVPFKLFTAGSMHVQRGGSFHGIDTSVEAEYDISYEAKDLGKRFKQEFACGSYFVDQAKWSRWWQNNSEAMNWLIDKAKGYGCKVVLEQGYNDEDYTWEFEPASHNFVMTDESLLAENGGIFSTTADFGAFMGATLINDIYQHEIEEVEDIDWRTKAEYLEKGDDGSVRSVIAQKLDEDGNGTGEYVRYTGTKGIVMATGDFSQDAEMLAHYCPWVYDNGMSSGWDVNYDTTFQFGGLMPGDGQKMGLWVGAAWQKAPNACLIDLLDGPYHKEIGNVDTINLNARGERFMNEDVVCSYSAINIFNQPGKSVYYVWPEEYADKYEEWNTFGATIPHPEDGVQYPSYCTATPEQEKQTWKDNVESGLYVTGGSIQEVLEQLDGIDVDAALATIERYNGYCDDGYDPEYLKNKACLDKIDSPSGVYYGYKITVGPDQLLGSTGGLRTNAQMQVCDENDEPIEGLYNIGVMVGDMYANTYNFCICGHNLSATCTTFPYLLAQDFADMA
jgi:hypothetical protein